MAMELKNIVELAKIAAGAKPNTQFSFNNQSFSYDEINETLRAELAELAPNVYAYNDNKNKIFQIIQEAIDEVLPAKVMEQYMMFADVKSIALGDKATFNIKVTDASRRRAKSFITKVGAAGRYEIFRLAGRSYDVTMSAIGGAAQVMYEELIRGTVNFADMVQIVLEGMDDRIYEMIAAALIRAISALQTANKVSTAGFDEEEMDRLLRIVDSYGSKANIYCTFEFAAKMLPANASWTTDAMKAELWNNGYLGNYKGHNVIVLKQAFIDETNTKQVLDPSYAWILPSGGEKPVKIVFEGTTQMREVESQDDWSKHIDMYKRVGVAAILTNNMAVYQDTALVPVVTP